MLSVRLMQNVPANFEVFRDEIASALEAGYGKSASEAYQEKAILALQYNLKHPQFFAWEALAENNTVGLLYGVLRGDIAELTFIYVLSTHRNQEVEEHLLKTAIATFRRSGVTGIISDSAPLAPLRLKSTFQNEGFTTIPRQLMSRSLPLSEPKHMYSESQAGLQEHAADIAACIVDAYQREPGKYLHPEVRNIVDAIDFVQRVAAGAYGEFSSQYARSCWKDGHCCGALLGCEMFPGLGFVLQLVVRHTYRRQGVAQRLLHDFAATCEAQGMSRLLLGVTCDNPALHLYEKMGFSILQPLNAYTWWQNQK